MKPLQQQINEINKDLRKDKKKEIEEELVKKIIDDVEKKLIASCCDKFSLLFTYNDFESDSVTRQTNNFRHIADTLGMMKYSAHLFDKLFYQSKDHILHGLLSPYFNDCKYILMATLTLDGSYIIIHNCTAHQFFGALWIFEARVASSIGHPLRGYMGN